jgi:ribosomal protein S25
MLSQQATIIETLLKLKPGQTITKFQITRDKKISRPVATRAFRKMLENGVVEKIKLGVYRRTKKEGDVSEFLDGHSGLAKYSRRSEIDGVKNIIMNLPHETLITPKLIIDKYECMPNSCQAAIQELLNEKVIRKVSLGKYVRRKTVCVTRSGKVTKLQIATDFIKRLKTGETFYTKELSEQLGVALPTLCGVVSSLTKNGIIASEAERGKYRRTEKFFAPAIETGVKRINMAEAGFTNESESSEPAIEEETTITDGGITLKGSPAAIAEFIRRLYGK